LIHPDEDLIVANIGMIGPGANKTLATEKTIPKNVGYFRDFPQIKKRHQGVGKIPLPRNPTSPGGTPMSWKYLA
tara:strand:- start:42 stop:263 length:222 start_codon:yes stop_codon:yes gene_type:complete